MLPSYTMMKQQHPLGSKPLEKSKVLDEGREREKSAAGSYLFIARIGVPC